MDATRTITRTGRRRSKEAGKPFLFVALQCDRPAAGGARIALDDAELVVIGRGASLAVQRQSGSLRIDLPDARASSTHLRLHRVLGSWLAEDAGSKNGTLVEGRRIEREPLADGAILELGHTFLLFRESLPDAGDLLEGRTAQTLHPALAAELRNLELMAKSRVPVLLRGESGTGKELLAASIHRLSGRPGAFVPVNCGAIAPNLVESELFGHTRGAFTSATEAQQGLIRAADRGTLLLDEIGDLPLPAQAALLRALQEEEVLPVGAAKAVKVDLRVVSATHRDLEALAGEERFRPDLLARLSGFVFTLPALRERREDFALLVAALLGKLSALDVAFSPEAARALLRHEWPLNIRELEKSLSSAAVLARGGTIEVEHLPAVLREPQKPQRSAPVLEPQDVERRAALVDLLRANAGNVTAVARAMGKARVQVQRWLRRYGLDPLTFRK